MVDQLLLLDLSLARRPQASRRAGRGRSTIAWTRDIELGESMHPVYF